MSDTREKGGLLGTSDRIELLATIVMALAAILTAWSAFQSSKWSGIQSIEFSQGNAARIESTRADTRAGQLIAIDLDLFTSWLDAVAVELREGVIEPVGNEGYVATPGTLSAFYFERMRLDFKVALDAWLETRPLQTEGAPPSPFAIPEYEIADVQLADDLLTQANEHSEAALEANQNGDNYVLATVGFALVIFFAGVSPKLIDKGNRWLALGLAMVLFVAGLVAVFSLARVPIF